MDDYLNNLRKAYDKGILQENQRLFSPNGKNEFSLVKKALAKHLSPYTKTIFDIGCGTGTYVKYLSEKGYKIGGVDISPKSINFLQKHHKNDNLLFSIVSSATNLGQLDLGTTDAILLLGPMYHLIEPNDREKVIKNCFDILNENGLIFVMYMNVLFNIDQNSMEKHNINDYIVGQDEMITWTDYYEEKIPQYRCSINKAEKDISSFFKIKEIIPIGTEKTLEQFLIVAKK